MAITIRKAVKEDMTNIRQLIQELADFEKMPDGPQLSVEDLIRDGGFDPTNPRPPLFFCFLAEEEDNSDSSTASERSLTPVGLALCFYTYSTWKGKTLFLEDLYVRPSHRKTGTGKRLFTEVLKCCRDSGCKALAFHVLDWNPAKAFYESFQAQNDTQKEGWQFYRLHQPDMIKLLEE